MLRKIRFKHLVFLWCLVPLIAVLELFLQWRLPHAEPSEQEWRAAATYVEQQKLEHDLVVFAPAWAVQARMYLDGLISLRDFGHFDTDRYFGIIELSVGGRRAPETEGLVSLGERDFGNITVRRYDNPSNTKILYDFLDHRSDMKVTGGKKYGLKLFNDHWFNPRYVIALDLKSKLVTATFKNVPLGGVIHGYTIIAYRRGRFNKGTPVEMTVHVNGKKIGERKIGNFDPIEPFDFPVNMAGTGTVQFKIKTPNPRKRKFGIAVDVRKDREVTP